VESLIKEIGSKCSLPVAVYPNSGEQYDAVTKTWSGSRDSIMFSDYARRWMLAGAAAVGGCCRTAACHVNEVARARTAVLMLRR
jgi:homocysteine S-methyltransferase